MKKTDHSEAPELTTDSSGSSENAVQRRIKRKALLIANNAYNKIENLKNAPYYDMEILKSYLGARHSFEGGDLKCYKDLKYEGMKRRMEDLIQDEDLFENDFVLFYYSGHGNRRRTDDETDRFESTLSPIDCSSYRDENAINLEISKSMLLGWAQKLLKRGVKLLMIIDCCFSGGLTPTNMRGQNALYPDTRPKSQQNRPECWGWPDADDEAFLENKNFAMLLASKDFEVAALDFDEKQYKIQKNRLPYTSIMTRFVLEVLEAQPENSSLSLEQVYEKLQYKMKARGKGKGNQNVQLFEDSSGGCFHFTTINGKSSFWSEEITRNQAPYQYILVQFLSETEIQFQNASIVPYVTKDSTYNVYDIYDSKMEDIAATIVIKEIKPIGNVACSFVTAKILQTYSKKESVCKRFMSKLSLTGKREGKFWRAVETKHVVCEANSALYTNVHNSTKMSEDDFMKVLRESNARSCFVNVVKNEEDAHVTIASENDNGTTHGKPVLAIGDITSYAHAEMVRKLGRDKNSMPSCSWTFEVGDLTQMESDGEGAPIYQYPISSNAKEPKEFTLNVTVDGCTKWNKILGCFVEINSNNEVTYIGHFDLYAEKAVKPKKLKYKASKMCYDFENVCDKGVIQLKLFLFRITASQTQHMTMGQVADAFGEYIGDGRLKRRHTKKGRKISSQRSSACNHEVVSAWGCKSVFFNVLKEE